MKPVIWLFIIVIEFIVACLLSALEYIHNNCILHRDVKPENLVFDGTGYIHLTDFGIARIWHSDNAQDTSGTPGYMGNNYMNMYSSRSNVQKQSWSCC